MAETDRGSDARSTWSISAGPGLGRSARRAIAWVLMALFGAVSLHAQSSAGVDLGRATLLPVHIVLMSVATASMLLGWYMAKFRRRKTKKWLAYHKAAQWTASITAVLGIATGAVMVEYSTGIHFRVSHSIVAAVSLALIVLSVGVAYTFLKWKKHKKVTRVIHRWAGRFTITAFIVTIILGMSAAGVF